MIRTSFARREWKTDSTSSIACAYGEYLKPDESVWNTMGFHGFPTNVDRQFYGSVKPTSFFRRPALKSGPETLILFSLTLTLNWTVKEGSYSMLILFL